jgi:hypothetical protein
MTKAIAIAVALVSLAIAPARAAAVHTDPVLEWNLHASNALTNPLVPPPGVDPGVGQTPPVSALHFAMVQGAVYDAVNAIDGTHEPYLDGVPAASPSASMDAAVATAAHHVLVGLTVSIGGTPVPMPQPAIDWLDAAYAASLQGIPEGAREAGIAIGEAAAAAMLRARADDGRPGTARYEPFTFAVGTEPGEWRPTGAVNDPFAWLRNVQPFLLERGDQLLTNGPHALTSGEYAKELAEVKELGCATIRPAPEGPPLRTCECSLLDDLGATAAVEDRPLLGCRTPEQDAIARFHTYHPLVVFNRAFREIAEAQELTLAEEARLFAMLNMAAADGAISCWNAKAHWSFWRPSTAIQLADTDGNEKTLADPAGTPPWMPLVANPPYPDHPSGFNCASSAFLHTAQDFFGTDKIAFTLRKSATEERAYQRFSSARDEIIDARVWAGIHFRAADVQAAGIGKDVAHWLGKYYFRPVH